MRNISCKKLINLIVIISISVSCSDEIPCGLIEVSNELRQLMTGSNGGCCYFTPSGNKSYVDRSLCNCDTGEDYNNSSNQNDNENQNNDSDNLNSNLILDKGIYIVSYNEVYQQPNWIEYTVSNRPKNVDRGSLDFYLENGVITSDDDDYLANVWDKGHLAPAASFSDTYNNLYLTFSFINCALQVDNLNRGEWAELEIIK